MKMVTLLALTLFLGGCATVGNQSLTARSQDWPAVTMTKAELIKELGPPNIQQTTLKDGQIVNMLTWIYSRAEFDPGLFIPVVGLIMAASGEGVTTEQRSLTVTFNHSGIMQSREWVQGQIGYPVLK